MTEELLERLEALVGSDDFEFESEEIMEELSDAGAGFETVEPLLAIMERHPLDDFGMPGAVVHFIEQFHPGHIPLLVSSLERSPAMHTVWMLNRCINGSENKQEYLAVLKGVADNVNADEAVRRSAKEFYDYQTK